MHLDRRNLSVLGSSKNEFNVSCWFTCVSELLQARKERNVPWTPTRHTNRIPFERLQVTIIQAYAPTADSDEEQHDLTSYVAATGVALVLISTVCVLTICDLPMTSC
uniref:Uncharacterized protein n=1 Tax=Haemonchus contortus TaxID=6289 RepID=A0A7I4YB67_HAECO